MGVKHADSPYLQDKIRLSNQVSILLIFLGLIYAGLSMALAPPAAPFPLIAAGIGALTLVLNATGWHRPSRILVSVGATVPCSIYHAVLVGAGEHVLLPFYLATAAFSLIPWVVFDLRERPLLLVSLGICAGVLVSQRVTDRLIEVAVDASPFRTFGLGGVTYFFALFTAGYCLYFFQRRNLEAQLARDDALAQLNTRYRAERGGREVAEEKGRSLEQQLQQAQKMEAIGRLAGGVAHDLNNLLMPVLGYAELLKEDHGSVAEVREHSDNILDAAERARALVAQLLAFGRRQTLERRRIQLNELISEFQTLFRRTIREDIDIRLDLDEQLPATVGDPGQIGQILMNLVVNAQDAMPRGGTIAVSTSAVTLDDAYADAHIECSPGPYVLLSVRDEGAGIEAQDLNHVFEPFFSTKGDSGTGLGLSTVYGIAKQHGGSVGVYSEVGQGSVFKVYLPVRDPESAESHEEHDDVEPVGGSETVLVAEDEPRVRALVEQYLRQLGYKVLLADDGASALELILASDSSAPIDLIVSDLVMPGLNGRELCQEARKLRPELRCLFMSGYPKDVIARYDLEPLPYVLQKPFSRRDLAQAIRRALA